jgi:queuine tRNA-ribosyltransferase
VSSAFRILRTGHGSQARAGILTTAHGEIPTPAFMPVATYGTVRGIPSHTLKDLGAGVLLMNFLHLYFYPGVEALHKAGGVQTFFSVPVPVLTDSGGYQVFSLKHMRTVREGGVTFHDPRSGRKEFLSPESVVRLEETMGVDIAMVLDLCIPPESTPREHDLAVGITTLWAARSLEAASRERTLLFGIVQGGIQDDLRERSARELAAMPFDGYGIGGLGLGESREDTFRALGTSVRYLPLDKPRYFMGMGYPEDIREAVDMGVDLFDCVLPTRNARNGQLFTSRGVLNYKNSAFRDRQEPPDPECACPACRHYTLAYLHAMYRQGEMTASILATAHNLAYYLDFLAKIRQNIASSF